MSTSVTAVTVRARNCDQLGSIVMRQRELPVTELKLCLAASYLIGALAMAAQTVIIVFGG